MYYVQWKPNNCNHWIGSTKHRKYQDARHSLQHLLDYSSEHNTGWSLRIVVVKG